MLTFPSRPQVYSQRCGQMGARSRVCLSMNWKTRSRCIPSIASSRYLSLDACRAKPRWGKSHRGSAGQVNPQNSPCLRNVRFKTQKKEFYLELKEASFQSLFEHHLLIVLLRLQDASVHLTTQHTQSSRSNLNLSQRSSLISLKQY